MSQLPTVPPTAPGEPLDIPFSLATTVGALELGVFLSVFLFGVLTVQTYIYFYRYPKDRGIFKLLVALTWIMDFGHTIAISHFIYTLTVTEYGQPEMLAIPPKSLDVAIFLSGWIGLLEQAWFTYRLYRFTKSLWLPLICAILALTRVGGSVGLFAVSLAAFTIQEYVTRVMWLIEAVIIVGAVLDVILAVSLCYYLNFWRRGGFRRMSKMVHQIMTWTIQTGIVTTTGALALLATFLTMKDNLIYLAFFFLMAKRESCVSFHYIPLRTPAVFSNSLLFSLNARERFARIFAEAFSTPGSVAVPRSLQLNSISSTDRTAEPSKPEHAHDRYATVRIQADADASMRQTSGPHSIAFLASPWEGVSSWP
ncbi:hypothetical protein C8F04DRAFT_1263044 [Mycena alexandri]|uniref:DUF6534 domain-containing protein n=1 Tax=Mycena alexandri TaxID=1745969 RepID=A0AAD6SQF5_9AGAR|nr:hypothetical protein C8F04DRAFT_1263044 [Mycena alexandri]